MYFLTHIFPISKAPLFSLSYFHAKSLKIGTLVRVQIGKNTVFGIVSKSEQIANIKLAIRRSGTTLKKIARVHEEIVLPETFVHAIEKTARHFLTTPGAILSQYLDPELLIYADVNNSPSVEHADFLELHTSTQERISFYKGIIRESFARDESITFVFPTIASLEFFKERLTTSISHRVHVLHAQLKKKENKLTSNVVAYFCTPQFFLNQPLNTRTCVVEYAQDIFPRLHSTDIRAQTFFKIFAATNFKKIIFSDDVVGVELFNEVRKKNFSEVSSRSFRIPYPITVEHFEIKFNDRELQIFSNTFIQKLSASVARGSCSLVVVNRTGYAPVVSCRDCGSIVKCKLCEHTLSLFSSSGSTRIFKCPSCGHTESTEARCTTCGSWRLQSFGLGIEQVYEQLGKQGFSNVLLFDNTHVKTRAQALRLLAEAASTPGSIILATEKILSYNGPRFSFVGIVSLDNLISLPDFSASERILYVATRLAALSDTGVLLQTRFLGESVFEALSKGHYGDFYKTELAIREKLNYPPNTLIIKLTFEPRKIEPQKIALLLEPWKPIVTEKSIILKIAKDLWPIKELEEKLLRLKKDVLVVVEPENLL